MADDIPGNAGAGAFSSPGVDQPQKPGQAIITTVNPVVNFKLHNVDPPSTLYLSQSERLLLSCINSDPGVIAVELHGRLLRAADGEITPFIFSMPVTSNRVAARQMFDIAEGYLLGAKILSSGGTNPGRTYVDLDVARGPLSGFTLYQQLIADYVSRGHDPTWPGGQFIHSTQITGAARSFATANPVAGSDLTVTVPTGARWKLKATRFRLVTSATVANRVVRYQITDGINPVFFGSFALTQVAGATVDYSVGLGTSLVNDATTNVISAPLPDNLMFAGWSFSTVTSGIQAGDQFSFINSMAEEWIEL